MAEFLTDEEIDALLNIAELQEDSFVDKIEQFKNKKWFFCRVWCRNRN